MKKDLIAERKIWRRILAFGFILLLISSWFFPPLGYFMLFCMLAAMVIGAAYNISARIKGTELKSYNPEVICILDTGQKGFFMVAKPLLPPRNTRIVKEGRWAHWLKIALEKYHMWKIKHGMI